MISIWHLIDFDPKREQQQVVSIKPVSYKINSLLIAETRKNVENTTKRGKKTEFCETSMTVDSLDSFELFLKVSGQTVLARADLPRLKKHMQHTKRSG